MQCVGVDVGGTHISCGRFRIGPDGVKVQSVLRQNVHAHGEAEKLLEEFATALQTVAGPDLASIAKIGFAFPGPFDYQNGICLIPPNLAKYEHLYGCNIRQELARRIPFQRPILFMNDAACFALGEHRQGGARGSRRTLALAIGTGFGSTFLAEGVPVTAGAQIPQDGMLWHVPHKGQIADETFSARGLLRAWTALTGASLQGVKELEALASSGDERARSVFAGWGEEMAAFLLPWLQSCDVDTIVIGGNIAKAWTWFIPALRRGIPDSIRLNPAELGESAQMLGAACISNEQERTV